MMRFTLNVEDLPYDAMGDYSAFKVEFRKDRKKADTCPGAETEKSAGQEKLLEGQDLAAALLLQDF